MFSLLMFELGLILGLYAPKILDFVFEKYHKYKMLKTTVELNKAILDMKKIQSDPIVIEFNKRKYDLAYSNKVERVKSKIEELKRSNFCNQVAEVVTGMLITQTADNLVESERLNGELDELYSPIYKNY